MKRPWSLRARLLVVSLSVLLAFVALTGLALDRALRDGADAAQQERLEALLYLLMGAVDVAADGRVVMPAQLPEARLATPASGIYAQIVSIRSAADRPGAPVAARWQSDSALGVEIPFGDTPGVGERSSEVRRGADGHAYRVVARTARWAIGATPSLITFSAAAPLASTGLEVEAYRHSLWSALAVMAALLLVSLVLVLHWGLRPVRRLARRLAAMQTGKVRDLAGPYPRELAPLALNLDRLLQRERTMLERHRKALGDLAHALKTPLAILRTAAGGPELAQIVQEQTQRMDAIVHYHLQRAATAGASQSASPIALAPLVARLCASMAKVHAERALTIDNGVPAELHARIDEGDAMELLGNLVDNACKWARTTVRVQALRCEGGLLLAVDDDGAGIADPQRLMQRGLRGDERVPGHGMGLAIVNDIALAYGGEVRTERSALGGARVSVWLAACY